jgi:hypothetical protein
VRIELADGNSVLSDAADVDAVLSRFFGRDVELARAAQNGYTIDQYQPDLENYDPDGHRDEVVEARLGAAFFNERGLPSAVPEDSFFDLYPLSVLTTSTLDQLGNLEPQSRFDVRRFRMNVIVDTRERGFVENGWLGRTLAIGDDVPLGVSLPDPRCCMPGLPREDVPRDPKSSRPSPATASAWPERADTGAPPPGSPLMEQQRRQPVRPGVLPRHSVDAPTRPRCVASHGSPLRNRLPGGLRSAGEGVSLRARSDGPSRPAAHCWFASAEQRGCVSLGFASRYRGSSNSIARRLSARWL